MPSVQPLEWGDKPVCVKCGCDHKITQQKNYNIAKFRGDFHDRRIRNFFTFITCLKISGLDLQTERIVTLSMVRARPGRKCKLPPAWSHTRFGLMGARDSTHPKSQNKASSGKDALGAKARYEIKHNPSLLCCWPLVTRLSRSGNR